VSIFFSLSSKTPIAASIFSSSESILAIILLWLASNLASTLPGWFTAWWAFLGLLSSLLLFPLD
jgi:membrane associated rhomboid family serine protease